MSFCCVCFVSSRLFLKSVRKNFVEEIKEMKDFSSGFCLIHTRSNTVDAEIGKLHNRETTE